MGRVNIKVYSCIKDRDKKGSTKSQLIIFPLLPNNPSLFCSLIPLAVLCLLLFFHAAKNDQATQKHKRQTNIQWAEQLSYAIVREFVHLPSMHTCLPPQFPWHYAPAHQGAAWSRRSQHHTHSASTVRLKAVFLPRTTLPNTRQFATHKPYCNVQNIVMVMWHVTWCFCCILILRVNRKKDSKELVQSSDLNDETDSCSLKLCYGHRVSCYLSLPHSFI